jgi:heat-inducible transcriptional repressor
VLSQASHVVSQASRTVGFALSSAHDAAVFDRVEFVPLGAARVLVVIVAKGGHVVQKVIDTGEPLTPDALRQAANYLNTEFSGLALSAARDAILERMDEERLLYDELMDQALKLGSSSFADLPEDHVLYVDGAASLLGEEHGLTLETMHALLEMIEEKRHLVQILNEYIDGTGLTVVIGAEHLEPTLRPFSLVACTFKDGTSSGTIGIIGPTRMRYSRAIAVVDGAAQAITRVLRDPD